MRTTLRGWHKRASTVAVGAATLGAAMVAGVPSVAAADFPGADEIVSSPNMKQVAHLAPTAPLADGVGTDIAFQGRYAFVGNYNGFTIYDIKQPKRTKIVSQVLCPGSQNDISITGNLLFLSTDSRRTDDSCASTAQNDGTKPYWEGIKIFDVSNKKAPRYIKSVETSCGSHTHTLVPDKAGKNAYLYISSYGPSETISELPAAARQASRSSRCRCATRRRPRSRPPRCCSRTAASPATAAASTPRAASRPRAATTSPCTRRRTSRPAPAWVTACCSTSPTGSTRGRSTGSRTTTHFAFWHSATFNNAGTKVIFTDELGGGGSATCNAEIGPERGADGIYDIQGRGDDRKLVFRSYFKIDRVQTDEENCVAHNGSLIPVKGKDIMVQSWYMGGVQVWDFTNSAHPKKIGFWERGPAADPDTGGGTWSAYYYNGYIYSSDLGKGLDVLQINDPRTDPAKGVRYDELNVQTQGHFGR